MDTVSQRPDYLAIQARILPLITSRLTGTSFEKDQSRFKTLNEQVGQDVKALLLEHYSQGYKFVICSQIVQNCGQAGSSKEIQTLYRSFGAIAFSIGFYRVHSHCIYNPGGILKENYQPLASRPLVNSRTDVSR
ncbi:uncharacterized protein MELLADRAFT_68473 [Melampsora larici-populina 98AG31]|uniref:Uncharacterized protein n=1 Tax=Melampsora larici-populina (strain 98AG31 / pathotype 3-4-7) TaxID=747676 RepID=F4S6Y0_MELLP|nr:uncharacterized protein MELLADRAFT_68473 [Melampsora larici-populina 98AG31]EGF99599.1 hypothetical protein MELLADRAFT_68473 [Melampsora larici-populina 98AG31]